MPVIRHNPRHSYAERRAADHSMNIRSGAPRCAAAGLDSGTAAELSASMPFDGVRGSLEAGYTAQGVPRRSLHRWNSLLSEAARQ